jgi:phospholipid/cholesterol/gamma-HCH transport system substrate-binding protein
MRMPLPRIAAIAALVIATAVIAVLLIGGGGGGYQIHARFPDAGQVVKGGLVEVAGRNVGKIDRIELTDDGMADVVLNLTDDEVKPLHQGTRAAIRAVGLSSVANRFVELTPGPADAPEIKDGGTLGLANTRGIVDLDVLLNTFDDTNRKRLQGIIAEAAKTLQQPTAGQLNRALEVLNPALSQTSALGRELTLDQAAFGQLIKAAGTTATALVRRPGELGGALASTSATLRQLAARREALGDTLDRAPELLSVGTKTLRDLQATLPAIDPVLRATTPAAPGISKLLRQLVPVTRDARPTFDAVLGLLPKAKAALHPLPALAEETVPALASASSALKKLNPILAGLRPYTPDLIAGFFEGFGGSTSGYYDANGHYTRISFNFGATGLPGLVPALPSGSSGGLVTKQLARCPGAATDPAADRSNPFNPVPGTKDVCDEGQAPK